MRYGCFALHSLFSHNNIEESVFLPTLAGGKPELAKKHPERQASFKVIPFANNIAD